MLFQLIKVKKSNYVIVESIYGSFSDNFYNSDGKDCNCVPLILQKNYKLKLQ